MGKTSPPRYLRVIDANYNRAKEGLRVCEDVCRFWIDDGRLTKDFKEIRHALTDTVKVLGLGNLIAQRDIEHDVGRKTRFSENRRSGPGDIFYANAQRVKESLRVLEEFSKLRDIRTTSGLKALRYKLYAIEKKVFKSGAFDAE